MHSIRVGIGGWVFPPWRGIFYPKGLIQARELEYASRQVGSIEINGTFYGAQKPASFRRWRDDAPDDFVFSVKGPRFATHRRELAESGPSIERFFDSGVLELGDKLGPILWQFPATTQFDEARLGDFLALLPYERDGRRIRHALEVRHASFAAKSCAALLKRHGVAAVLVDADGQTEIDPLTADFVYLRLKRADAELAGGYSPASLAAWRKRVGSWAKTRDCFVYFIGGGKIRNPAAAMALIRLLSRGAGSPGAAARRG
jgi:uncharacterized protein YecE (DUF72 family)